MPLHPPVPPTAFQGFYLSSEVVPGPHQGEAGCTCGSGFGHVSGKRGDVDRRAAVERIGPLVASSTYSFRRVGPHSRSGGVGLDSLPFCFSLSGLSGISCCGGVVGCWGWIEEEVRYRTPCTACYKGRGQVCAC